MPDLPTSTAAQWVVDHWSDLPHLAELPSRGPWSSMIGRAGAFLPELPLDLTAHGWRVVGVAGADQRRIETHLRSDIDALEDALAGERVRIKTQVAGPWTLASALEGSTGRRLLQDVGAVRDLAQSLAEGIAEHLKHLSRIATEVVVQIDEPSIAAVRRGSGASLFSAPRVPDDEEILAGWRALRTRLGEEVALVVHSCDDDLPWHLLSPFDAVSIDGDLEHPESGVGSWLDQGRAVWWGTTLRSDLSSSVTRVRGQMSRWGFGEAILTRLSLTPSCGLAGRSMHEAEAIFRNLRDLRDALGEAEA